MPIVRRLSDGLLVKLLKQNTVFMLCEWLLNEWMILPKKKVIHHSDRGCQYASKEYTTLLIEYGVTISMTEDGNPKDNAQAERINNTMKNELLKGKMFCNVKKVRDAVEQAVLFYNTRRPHMSINMMTPKEAATHICEIKKGWTSYRDTAIKNLQPDNFVSNECLSLGA